jgi:hypothetical protein
MMLALALGVSSAVAIGYVAWWGRQSTKLEIVNLCRVAPASKRSKRTAILDAVVLHQMSLSRENDPQRYRRVTAHFVIIPDGRVVQLHPLSARLDASNVQRPIGGDRVCRQPSLRPWRVVGA